MGDRMIANPLNAHANNDVADAHPREVNFQLFLGERIIDGHQDYEIFGRVASAGSKGAADTLVGGMVNDGD